MFAVFAVKIVVRLVPSQSEAERFDTYELGVISSMIVASYVPTAQVFSPYTSNTSKPTEYSNGDVTIASAPEYSGKAATSL